MKDLYAENCKIKKNNWWKKLKMIQRNGKISHALGLRELILLTWAYYPKQSTDLMQSIKILITVFT